MQAMEGIEVGQLVTSLANDRVVVFAKNQASSGLYYSIKQNSLVVGESRNNYGNVYVGKEDDYQYQEDINMDSGSVNITGSQREKYHFPLPPINT